MGETRGFFGRVVEAGSHQNSIRLVCTGEIDAAAIDTQVLAIELRDHPELAAQLRVIDVLGPSPIQPVVAASRLPDSLKAGLRAALLELGEDTSAQKHLAHGFVDRFVPVVDADYDPIREMLKAAESVEFMRLR
jgi:phosphonate transport system substrate-binding protein